MDAIISNNVLIIAKAIGIINVNAPHQLKPSIPFTPIPHNLHHLTVDLISKSDPLNKLVLYI